jgi:polar amino acid transport system permease protein
LTPAGSQTTPDSTHSIFKRGQLDFGAVLAQWPMLLQGIAWTAGLTAVSTVAGLGLGIAAAWARNEGPLPLRWTVGLYVELIRNTPFIIQLFFGLPALGLQLSPA